LKWSEINQRERMLNYDDSTNDDDDDDDNTAMNKIRTNQNIYEINEKERE